MLAGVLMYCVCVYRVAVSLIKMTDIHVRRRVRVTVLMPAVNMR